MENKIKKKLKIHLSKVEGSMNMFIFKNGLYLRINRYSQADFYQLRFQQMMQSSDCNPYKNGKQIVNLLSCQKKKIHIRIHTHPKHKTFHLIENRKKRICRPQKYAIRGQNKIKYIKINLLIKRRK